LAAKAGKTGVLAFFKRFRELFILGALLLVPLVTYLAYDKRGRDLNSLDRAVIWAATPIERVVTNVINGAIDRWHGWIDLREVRKQNLELRRENLGLREQLARLSESRLENERLRKMLAFAESSPAPVLTAPVIGEAPVMNLLTVKIGKGTQDGVRKDMAVVTSEGIVGRVLTAATHSADVLLLTDSNFALPVRVQRSRARAKVVGQGARARPALVQAQRTEDIEDGDILVTAGTDGIFPKGLVVGRVSRVVRPNHGMFLSAEVAPAVDLVSGADGFQLEEVFVIMGLPGREDLPEAFLPVP
jgi:rod shape-determining protein MreC